MVVAELRAELARAFQIARCLWKTPHKAQRGAQIDASVGDVVDVALPLVDVYDGQQLLHGLLEIPTAAESNAQLLARLRDDLFRRIVLREQLAGALQGVPRCEVVALNAQAHAMRHQRLRQRHPVPALLQQHDRLGDEREGGIKLVKVVQHPPLPEHQPRLRRHLFRRHATQPVSQRIELALLEHPPADLFGHFDYVVPGGRLDVVIDGVLPALIALHSLSGEHIEFAKLLSVAAADVTHKEGAEEAMVAISGVSVLLFHEDEVQVLQLCQLLLGI